MLHALTSRRTGKSASASALAEVMTPSLYLRLRREAAGLSRIQVAQRLYDIQIKRVFGDRRPRRLYDSVAQALATVRQLEAPGAYARYRPMIDFLGGVVPLDVDVYHQLRNEPADRHPLVCRGCGCSMHDACGGACTLTGRICRYCATGARKIAA
ncbi:hypothetical protein [Sphingomonas sp.]|jgi:hypothetical protein|uniref:hypothetical protein n=1 Tax=Sphingomonas sp. TaxID=28214 RepID=UPI0026176E66|nr:hypothetical protein [Sphingomonas sp.]MDF2495194.1 hypothetical protein [Sphingomonas sp.]